MKTLYTIALLSLALSAHAGSLRALDLEDLNEKSSVILEGTVLDIESLWEGRMIFTDVHVGVDRCFKGACEVEVLTVRVLGGAVDDLEMRVQGVSQYRLGEQVLLFLNPLKRSERLHTIGMFQGKFQIQETPEGIWALRSGSARLVGAKKPTAESLDQIPLALLEEELEDYPQP